MSSTPKAAQASEFMHLDALRFLASIGIVWLHSHEFFYAPGSRVQTIAPSNGLALFVDLFFVISGFVIYVVYSYRVNNVSSFFCFIKRRIGRLYPLHLLTLFIATGLWMIADKFAAANSHLPDMSARCLVPVALLLNLFAPCGPNGPPNGVSWSIATEMILYVVVFGLICLLRRWRWALPIAFAGSFVFAAHEVVVNGQQWDHLAFVTRAAPSFLLGCLFARHRAAFPAIAGSTGVVMLLFLVLLIAMEYGLNQFVILALIYFLIFAAVSADMGAPAVSFVKITARLGALTYSIYLWHPTFVFIMMNVIGDKILHLHGLAAIPLALTCYCIIMIVSYYSWSRFETPARQWIDRLNLGASALPLAKRQNESA